MKTYAAIGHFKWNENTTSVAMKSNSKKDFIRDLRGNEFVAYAVLTESMVEKFHSLIAEDDCFGIYNQVKKLTTNYRVWNEVTDYIEQCFDIMSERIINAD